MHLSVTWPKFTGQKFISPEVLDLEHVNTTGGNDKGNCSYLRGSFCKQKHMLEMPPSRTYGLWGYWVFFPRWPHNPCVVGAFATWAFVYKISYESDTGRWAHIKAMLLHYTFLDTVNSFGSVIYKFHTIYIVKVITTKYVYMSFTIIFNIP